VDLKDECLKVEANSNSLSRYFLRILQSGELCRKGDKGCLAKS